LTKLGCASFWLRRGYLKQQTRETAPSRSTLHLDRMSSAKKKTRGKKRGREKWILGEINLMSSWKPCSVVER
jgi:hypothetical protein